MKLQSLLQCSQSHTTDPYPGPIKSIILTPHILNNDISTVLPSSHMWSLPLRFCPKLCKHFSCTTSVLQLSTYNSIQALMTIIENTLNTQDCYCNESAIVVELRKCKIKSMQACIKTSSFFGQVNLRNKVTKLFSLPRMTE
jgi:hypothetical protein